MYLLVFGLIYTVIAGAEGFVPSASATTTIHGGFTSSSSKQHFGGGSGIRVDLLSTTTPSTDNATSNNNDIASQLDEILKAKSPALLETYNELRISGTPEAIESYLNSILEVVDQVQQGQEEGGGESKKQKNKVPWWTKLRFTARLSKRARLASLRRVLDLSTPTVEETQDLGDDLDAKQRRRRRALVVLLRTLASSRNDDVDEGDNATTSMITINPIYKVEKAAMKDLKNTVSATDMESRLPPGLETPKYDVIVRRPVLEGGYEVRNYEAFSVCSVPMSKPRPDVESTDQKVKNPQLVGASSFGALAGYLFGKNEEQKAMKMTTPVLTQGQGDEKEMSFVLPSDYWSSEGMSKAPTPLANSLVQVKRDEGGLRAAIMFGGFASSKDVRTKKQQLLKGLEKDKEWMSADDQVALAQYNDPFTPPWKRRNEVSVAVKRRN